MNLGSEKWAQSEAVIGVAIHRYYTLHYDSGIGLRLDSIWIIFADLIYYGDITAWYSHLLELLKSNLTKEGFRGEILAEVKRES